MDYDKGNMVFARGGGGGHSVVFGAQKSLGGMDQYCAVLTAAFRYFCQIQSKSQPSASQHTNPATRSFCNFHAVLMVHLHLSWHGM